jgi:acyl carrier protein
MSFNETILAEIAELLEIDKEDLSDTYVFPEEWNSLVVIGVIALVDDHFGKTIDLDQLKTCRTLAQLHTLIAQS